jgi:cytochrome P450
MATAFAVERVGTELLQFEPPAPVPKPAPLGILELLWTLKRNPLECWAQEHFNKEIVWADLPLGRAVVLNQPDAIRRVLVENQSNYQKDTLQKRVLSAGLGDGLLSVEGERWRTQRRTLAPLFARRTVLEFSAAMLAAAEALVARWSDVSGAIIDVAAEMTRTTLDVLQRTIFSDGLRRDPEEFRVAMGVYFNTVGRIGLLDLLGAPEFLPRMSHLKVRSTLKFFEAAVDEIIAIRARRPERQVRDILSLLLSARDPETNRGLDEREVRANILTFIAAGHETTANALTWSLFLLSRSPRWRALVEREASSELARGTETTLFDRLVCTRAVVEEAIRLYPPIAAISRVALDSDTLAGEAVRAGTIVVIAPYVLHRHRLLWERPGVFDPGRFCPGNRESINRFAYLPFGAGPRTCIGSSFAMQEAVLVLATIAKAFTFELAPEHPVWPVLRVTLRPERGVHMVINRKSCAGRPAGVPRYDSAQSNSHCFGRPQRAERPVSL